MCYPKPKPGAWWSPHHLRIIGCRAGLQKTLCSSINPNGADRWENDYENDAAACSFEENLLLGEVESSFPRPETSALVLQKPNPSVLGLQCLLLRAVLEELLCSRVTALHPFFLKEVDVLSLCLAWYSWKETSWQCWQLLDVLWTCLCTSSLSNS